MAKRIIVAGGGHGGIACAALLAQAGFDVTVYEKNSRDNMGYDWTDIFDPKSLRAARIPMPSKDKYEYKTNMTFIPPSARTPVTQDVPQSEAEIKMERSDIYDLIITHAEKSGVKFVFDCTVKKALMAGDRVVGISTEKGDFFADMVIDACGCESIVRASLPDICGIQKHTNEFEKFYVYRAFYNRASDKEPEYKYKVYMLPNGRMGIGWVACEGEYSDLLIGEFEPFTVEEAEQKAEFFRKDNPVLGDKVLRGGYMVEIPVRQPLAIMVADGYAAIGDSAFMTVPIIGSGLADAFKAAAMLAEVIINDTSETYCAEVLWEYQMKYFKALGNGMAPLALVKLLLTKITPEQLDYLFDNGILGADELTITADSTSLGSMLSFDPALLGKAKSLVKDKALTRMVMSLGKNIAKASTICASMPKHYSKFTVQNWARRYEKLFKVHHR